MMKIAHCMCSLEGGVGKVVMNYFDNMPNKDYEVHIITQAIGSEEYVRMYEKRGYIIHVISSKKEGLYGNLEKTYHVFKDEQIDIVHCHMTATNFFPLLMARFAGINVRINHSHLAEKKNILEKILCFFAKYIATDRFACGQAAGESVFGNSSFTIMQNAIDLKKYKYSKEVRESEREELGVTDKKVICHVGRFCNQKNHKFLIDVFECLCRQDSSYKLMLVGDGELMDKIKLEVELRNLSENVFFLGLIDDVNRKLQASDAFVLPSLFEGLCLAAIEAQAAGVPCRLSKTVDYLTKINDNVSFVEDFKAEEWAKSIREALQEERIDNQKKLAAGGFDIETEARKLDEFYKSALNRKL